MDESGSMQDIKVKVGGQAYAMACEEGQEARLSELAAMLDARYTRLQTDCPGIADKHLLVMVGILLCDDIEILRQEVHTKETEIASRERSMRDERDRRAVQDQQKVESIKIRQERVNRLIDKIEKDGRY